MGVVNEEAEGQGFLRVSFIIQVGVQVEENIWTYEGQGNGGMEGIA